MGAETSIEWAHHTWNPWYGCTRVSEGCEHCYALRRMTQLKRVKGEGDIRRASKATWRFPLSKKVQAGDRVFVCSWSDFFHPRVASGWRHEAVRVMVQRPDLAFLILTKRVGRMADQMAAIRDIWRWPVPNIWLGVTAENQARADERIPVLLSIDWPGKKFVSIEPMLGPVDLERPWGQGVGDLALDTLLHTSHLDWVICGGESGPNARPMNPEWARGVREKCIVTGTPFFFKQWGEWAPSPGARWHHHKLARMYDGWTLPAHGGRILRDWTATHYFDAAKANGKVFRVGKKHAGRLLDGRTWDEVPG